jgi:hypothetical protein
VEDPGRIVDSGNEWAREIIRSARSDVPSEQFRRRLARQLGVASAAAGLSAAASAKAVATGLWLKWMVVGAAAGVLTAGGATAVVSLREANPAASVATRSRVAPPANEPAARAQLGAQPLVREATAPALTSPASHGFGAVPNTSVELRAAGSPKGNAPVARSRLRPNQLDRNDSNALRATAAGSQPSATPSASSAAATLLEELALINSVRVALANNAADAALRSLDDYASKHPSGGLTMEALVLRVSALAALGDRASAKRLADAFLATHPDSPYAQRLRLLTDVGADRDP